MIKLTKKKSYFFVTEAPRFSYIKLKGSQKILYGDIRELLRGKGKNMDDSKIVELYVKRSEAAVSESQNKYGKYCGVIANNILRSDEDAEECVNDTWFKAWNIIPPHLPPRLDAFFGKLTRNLAIDMFRRRRTDKRGKGEMLLCLEELAECVGKEETFTDTVALRDALDRFLENLASQARKLFILRYWYMFSLKESAKRCGVNEGTAKMSLYRTRAALRDFLKEEGFDI